MNAAREFIASTFAPVLKAGRPPKAAALISDDFSYLDRRSGPANMGRLDEADWPTFVSLVWELGTGDPRLSVGETVGQRGEALAAALVEIDYGNGFSVEFITLFQLNDSLSHVRRIIDFDLDDVDSAIAALDELSDEGRDGSGLTA